MKKKNSTVGKAVIKGRKWDFSEGKWEFSDFIKKGGRKPPSSFLFYHYLAALADVDALLFAGGGAAIEVVEGRWSNGAAIGSVFSVGGVLREFIYAA